MNESNNDEKIVADVLNKISDDKLIKEMFQQSKDSFLEIAEILTYEELKELFDVTGWEAFHRLASQNEMIQRVFDNETEYPDDLFDYYLQALQLICQNEKESLTDFNSRQDIIDVFDESVKEKKDSEAAIIHSWLTDKADVKNFMFAYFPLCCIKVLLGYFDEFTEGWKVKLGDYETKLKCECGMYFNHMLAVGDSREVFNCCTRCGRCITTMKLVSTSRVKLVKNKNRRVLGIFKVDDKEVINYGMVDSPYKVVDLNAAKYKVKKTTRTKPRGKKTLKDSMKK